MSRRTEFTRKQRAAIALRAAGCCEACGARLKAGEGDADHILPVELGGESEVSNAQWLCRPCHRAKTTTDIQAMRRAERQRDRHTGAMPRSRRPMPFSRVSPWKRRLDGTIVRRQP